MRHIIIATMIINLFVVSGCSCFSGNGDDCCCRREYSDMWDRYDCPSLHRNVIMPREFYDPRDFRPDSGCGGYHAWRNDDYSRFYDDSCRYHHGGSRQWKSYHRHHRRSSLDTDALSERHLPPPTPDREYNE